MGRSWVFAKTVKLLNLCFEKNLHFGSFENPSELTNDIGKSACLLGNTSTHSWWISIVMLVFGGVNPWKNSTEVLVGHQGQMIS